MSVEALVCGYIDGSITPPTRLRGWVEEYQSLEDRTIKGHGDEVVDARMNLVYDYLMFNAEGEQR